MFSNPYLQSFPSFSRGRSYGPSLGIESWAAQRLRFSRFVSSILFYPNSEWFSKGPRLFRQRLRLFNSQRPSSPRAV